MTFGSSGMGPRLPAVANRCNAPTQFPLTSTVTGLGSASENVNRCPSTAGTIFRELGRTFAEAIGWGQVTVTDTGPRMSK
jgi:hypothetical protein